MKNVYEDLLKTKKYSNCQKLIFHFINFLIRHGDIPEAIYYIKNVNVGRSYFHYCEKIKYGRIISQFIKSKDNFNRFTEEYEYVFEYDETFLHMMIEISDILKDKLIFWREVAR
jgi:hypothetical protein